MPFEWRPKGSEGVNHQTRERTLEAEARGSAWCVGGRSGPLGSGEEWGDTIGGFNLGTLKGIKGRSWETDGGIETRMVAVGTLRGAWIWKDRMWVWEKEKSGKWHQPEEDLMTELRTWVGNTTGGLGWGLWEHQELSLGQVKIWGAFYTGIGKVKKIVGSLTDDFHTFPQYSLKEKPQTIWQV